MDVTVLHSTVRCKVEAALADVTRQTRAPDVVWSPRVEAGMQWIHVLAAAGAAARSVLHMPQVTVFWLTRQEMPGWYGRFVDSYDLEQVGATWGGAFTLRDLALAFGRHMPGFRARGTGLPPACMVGDGWRALAAEKALQV
jgi:hypothetical protein